MDDWTYNEAEQGFELHYRNSLWAPIPEKYIVAPNCEPIRVTDEFLQELVDKLNNNEIELTINNITHAFSEDNVGFGYTAHIQDNTGETEHLQFYTDKE